MHLEQKTHIDIWTRSLNKVSEQQVGLEIKICKLLYVERVSNRWVAIESPSCHDDIHSFSWMECIPKHILVSIHTWHLVWKTCYLSSVPPDPAATTIRHRESYILSSQNFGHKKNSKQTKTFQLIHMGYFNQFSPWTYNNSLIKIKLNRRYETQIKEEHVQVTIKGVYWLLITCVTVFSLLL